ncbi:hypothetical protein C4K35_4133 [Pseudomonas chlororaphis subsp. piscium]|uniref:fimbrial protein n=1 Tax=Pseudomonas chlororaphis TaxID=587753 RepID=UPI000F7114BA|nr:fimbrial protein [Pseudomonas chlororaphis]AZC51712.1 hypothetical protein C4K35_4133 [Pseudomonas chlororaphis subsp. piscium]
MTKTLFPSLALTLCLLFSSQAYSYCNADTNAFFIANRIEIPANTPPGEKLYQQVRYLNFVCHPNGSLLYGTAPNADGALNIELYWNGKLLPPGEEEKLFDSSGNPNNSSGLLKMRVLRGAGPVKSESLIYYGDIKFREISNTPVPSHLTFRKGVSIMQTTLASCIIETPNLQVNLPRISTTALSGHDTQAGRTEFSLPISCHEGTKLKTYFLDTNAPTAPNQSYLGLSGDSTATGVALSLALNDRPIIIGASHNYDININDRFTVSYKKTLGTLKPGSVRAQASYVLSYD